MIKTSVSVKSQSPKLLTENARVVAVESDAVWLETIRQSSCGQCALQKGCGQSLLQSLFKTTRQHMRISTQGFNSTLAVDDRVEIGIPNAAVLQGSLVLYLLPLLALIVSMIVATNAMLSEGWVLVLGFMAMFLSMLLLRLILASSKIKEAIEPQILRRL